MNHQAGTGSGTCTALSSELLDPPRPPPSFKTASRSSSSKRISFPVRQQIVDRFQNGESVSHIAKAFGISECGVRKTWSRFQSTGSVKDRSSGRLAKTSGVPSSVEVDGVNSISLKEEQSVDGDSGIGSQDTVSAMGCGSSVTAHMEGGKYLNGNSPPSLLSPANNEHTATFQSLEGSPRDLSPHNSKTKEPVINSLLFDTPQLDLERIGPVPDKYTILTVRRGRSRRSLNRPYPREHMLPIIQGCPLATMKEQNCNHDNRHVENIAKAKSKPLYGECLWGFPYGRAPEAGYYEAVLPREDNPIVVDPCNPLAKTLLADLGYSTQVFFNACCKPPNILDSYKVACSLPFTLQPSTLAESTRQFYQVFIGISSDPAVIFNAIPEGSGPAISVQTTSGQTLQKNIFTPVTLSQYWSLIMDFVVEKLNCCENFISASPPSSPCLVCHPFVRDPTPPSSPTAHQSSQPHSAPADLLSPPEPPAKRRCSSGSGERETSSFDVDVRPHSAQLFDSRRNTPPMSSISPSLSQPMHTDTQVPLVIKSPYQLPRTQQVMFLLSHLKQSGNVMSFPGQQSVPSRGLPPNPQLTQWPRPPHLAFTNPGLSSSSPIGIPIHSSYMPDHHGNTNSPPKTFTPILQPQTSGESPPVLQTSFGTTQSNGRSTTTAVTMDTSNVSQQFSQASVMISDRHITSVKSDTKSLQPDTALKIVDSDDEDHSDNALPKSSDDLCLPIPSSKLPKEWSVEDVRVFVQKITDVKCSQIFQEQEVDGQALLLLTTDVMVSMMKIKIGPALKLMKFIDALKDKFGSS